MPTQPVRATPPVLSIRNWWLRLAAGSAVACAVWLLVDAVATAIFGPDYSLPSHVFRAIVTCLLVIVALAGVLRWEHTRPADYGVTGGERMRRGLAQGVVGYLIPFGAATFVILLLGIVRFDIPADPLTVIGQGLLVLTLVILYEAVPEELIFRGYLFRVLAERLPSWLTILVQALMFCGFGIVVGAAATFDRILLFFVFSLALGVLRQVTGTVFATIGFHAVFQMLAQWSLGDRWNAVVASDPGEWYGLVALGIAPFALAPVVARALMRRGKRTP
jgi:membrane protease YdiL (CAAX protease family)